MSRCTRHQSNILINNFNKINECVDGIICQELSWTSESSNENIDSSIFYKYNCTIARKVYLITTDMLDFVEKKNNLERSHNYSLINKILYI